MRKWWILSSVLCVSAVAVAVLAAVGDFDRDGDTDLLDLVALHDCITGPHQAPVFLEPSTDCQDAFDADTDTDVDLADMAAYQAGFTGPGPSALVMTPHRHIFVNTGETHQLTVTAHNPDQTTKDVTNEALFTSDDPSVASISPAGLIAVVADGETIVRAEYEGLYAACDVLVTTAPPTQASQSGWIDGIVYDSPTDTPLEGAVVSIKDHDEWIPGRIITGPDGKFAFPTPGRGFFFVTIAKNGHTYAQRRVEVTQTLDSAVDPVYLLPQAPPLLPVTAARDRTIRAELGLRARSGLILANKANTLQIMLPSSPVLMRSGSKLETPAPAPTQITATEVNRSLELPGALPEQSEFTYAFFFDMGGEDELAEPATIRFANTRSFAPGTPIPVGRWNDRLLKWEHESLAMVSADGEWVTYQARRFSGHDINCPAMRNPQEGPTGQVKDQSQPEATPPGGQSCTGVPGSSFVAVRTGELNEEHVLPSYRSIGAARTVRLMYQSRAAKPAAVIAHALNVDPNLTIVPEAHGFEIRIEGSRRERWTEGVQGSRRHAFLWDGRNGRGELLPTGSYFYYARFSNEYSGTFATSVGNRFGGPPEDDLAVSAPERIVYPSSDIGTVAIRNERDSPIGAGWTVTGVQRLFMDADQRRATLSVGNGQTLTFQSGLDMLVYNFVSEDVSVLLSRGDGTFDERERITVERYVRGMLISDFDQDGFQDWCYIHSDDSIRLRLGNGDGTFQGEHQYGTGQYPNDVEVGDFNGDGKEDLVTANWGGKDVSILLGNGDGTFKEHQDYETRVHSEDLAVADFNGDSQMDLATINGYVDHGDVAILAGERGWDVRRCPGIAYRRERRRLACRCRCRW